MRGVIATAVPLLALWGCIWPEPISEEPGPADSAPSILQAFPDQHQVDLDAPNDSDPSTACFVTVGLDDVYSPQGQPLYAQFYLNFEQNPTSPGQAIPVGQSVQIDLQQQQSNANLYLLQPYELSLAAYPQALFPISPGSPANVLTVFVSDGFDPNDPSQPIDSSHYVTSWDWQVTVTNPTCLAQLTALAQ